MNLAEKYQTPVTIVSDKHLSESSYTTPALDPTVVRIDRGKLITEREAMRQHPFRRYRFTDDGVSPRTIPGQAGGFFLANSDEHDEFGFSDESAENRVRMVDKRHRKLVKAMRELPKAMRHGAKHASFVFISAGSTKSAILEAMELLRKDGIRDIGFLQLYCLSPIVDGKELDRVMTNEGVKTVIVENNKTGQIANLIREQTGHSPDYNLLKYDGRQFFPSEIARAVKKFL
jgi:2-oxoglutarate ferredoxin oxidoreductase subunit alpha